MQQRYGTFELTLHDRSTRSLEVHCTELLWCRMAVGRIA